MLARPARESTQFHILRLLSPTLVSPMLLAACSEPGSSMLPQTADALAPPGDAGVRPAKDMGTAPATDLGTALAELLVACGTLLAAHPQRIFVAAFASPKPSTFVLLDDSSTLLVEVFSQCS